MTLREALLLVLDQVDYTNGACRPNEMVAAVLPEEIIQKARQAIFDSRTQELSPARNDG